MKFWQYAISVSLIICLQGANRHAKMQEPSTRYHQNARHSHHFCPLFFSSKSQNGGLGTNQTSLMNKLNYQNATQKNYFNLDHNNHGMVQNSQKMIGGINMC